ncbi:MAG: restriction endonuclease subunit S [Veillonella sp.]|nr:restriction endonuclease subunit S [Veillonella sp.]
MSKWQNVHLGDIIKTNQSTYSPKENWKFVNYLDTGNITANRVEKIQYINTDIDKLPSRAKRKVKRDSIIYSTVRPNQLHYGIIKNQPDNFLVSTGFVVIDVNTDKAIPEYIYYVLSQNEIIEHLQAIAELLLPNIEIQKRIVSILSVIDGKITVNETINNNLAA